MKRDLAILMLGLALTRLQAQTCNCPAGPPGAQGPAGTGIVTINGTEGATWNLNGTTPAADSGYTAATFKTDGATNVIAEVPSAGSLSPTAVGGYLGNWENTSLTSAPTANGDFNQGTTNLVYFWMFRLPYSFTFNTLTVTTTQNIAASTTVSMGVYSGSGTRLVHWDNISYTKGLQYVSATPAGGAVTLPAGFYYWAASVANNGSTQCAGGLSFGASEATRPWNVRGTVRTGTAANLAASGVMPATLGTLTAGYPLTGQDLPMWIVESN